MDTKQIQSLANEPAHVQSDREIYTNQLEKLEAGLKTLNILSREESSLVTPIVFGKFALQSIRVLWIYPGKLMIFYSSFESAVSLWYVEVEISHDLFKFKFSEGDPLMEFLEGTDDISPFILHAVEFPWDFSFVYILLLLNSSSSNALLLISVSLLSFLVIPSI
jgi:hypothetical protein